MKQLSTVLLASLLLAAGLLIGARGTGQLAAQARLPPARFSDDNTFILDAFALGTGDVILGESAARRSGNKEVESFARNLLAPQRKLNEALLLLARGNKLAVEAAEKQARDDVADVEKLGRSNFDRGYLRFTVQNDGKLLALAEAKAKGKGSEATREVASRMLPVLQARLKEARALQGKIEK